MSTHIKNYTSLINKKLNKHAFCSTVKLETRFTRVRSEETNVGNLAADLIRSYHEADIGI